MTDVPFISKVAVPESIVNSTESVPSPPLITSSPVPPIRVSSPSPPLRVSSPLPPSSVSAPAPPSSLSFPASPLKCEPRRSGAPDNSGKPTSQSSPLVAVMSKASKPSSRKLTTVPSLKVALSKIEEFRRVNEIPSTVRPSANVPE